ncbi:histone deacetylase 6-like, partial [Rhincodon typus]|uniref:histone deacetylase 6-like n=1 Tax=Rhincodon typus TaxID=259920 RepID=UPI00202F9F11
FQPDLVLVSAGFDAARGDPLGGCEVTPECYAHMTHMIMCLAGGRVVFALEGGYNLTAISESMAMCTRTLLGDTPPYLEPMGQPASSATETINNVISVHHKYWASLRLLSPELELQSKAKGTTWSQQPPPTAIPSQESRVQVSQSRRTSMWLQQQGECRGTLARPRRSRLPGRAMEGLLSVDRTSAGLELRDIPAMDDVSLLDVEY